MPQMILDWIGYVASLIVLVSLLMSSIKKLRWINLVGALVFGIYGFMIHSLPTGFMNVGIVLIDVYYLAKIYFNKEYFTILPIDDESVYLQSFIDFYKSDISQFTDIDRILADQAEIKLYVLRNMTPAAVFVCHKHSTDTLEIRLDYAIPQYRDFKLGTFIFEQQKQLFLEKGYSKFIAYTSEPKHMGYLKRMGFSETKLDGKTTFLKEIK